VGESEGNHCVLYFIYVSVVYKSMLLGNRAIYLGMLK